MIFFLLEEYRQDDNLLGVWIFGNQFSVSDGVREVVEVYRERRCKFEDESFRLDYIDGGEELGGEELIFKKNGFVIFFK